jgi:hypothetical protein
MQKHLRVGLLAAAVGLVVTAAIYKRWSDDLAWGVCRVAAWRSFGGGPLPVRPDTLRIEGWGALRDVEAVYRWPEARGYVGCTMTWDREAGWFPHELVAGPTPPIIAAEPAVAGDAGPAVPSSSAGGEARRP